LAIFTGHKKQRPDGTEIYALAKYNHSVLIC